MGNSIQKLLKRVSRKDLESIINALERIEKRNFEHLDIKKLKGTKDIFRVRVGKYRIIYKISGAETLVLENSKRDEQTYQNY